MDIVRDRRQWGAFAVENALIDTTDLDGITKMAYIVLLRLLECDSEHMPLILPRIAASINCSEETTQSILGELQRKKYIEIIPNGEQSIYRVSDLPIENMSFLCDSCLADGGK